ncbi:mechanosensitive ion channel family protein [Mobilitalea sibirica]|uniref:Mechanosensing system component YbdG n=1 Tax=Mobilitalea sibirica TaxID=1462919 RepID=A0A8J7L3D3_9FIRM|nr:mechanosensitive ion channel family protein [Mobilitalea sibirica]MBH1942338.1 mechanosensitive ion channel family protein [Mobilitalea sibirica]
MNFFKQLLVDNGVSEKPAGYLSYGIIIIIIILICFIANLLMKKIVLKLLTRFIRNNKYEWDNVLLERGVFNRVVHLTPAIIIYMSAPLFKNIQLMIFDDLQEVILRLASTYILIASVFVFSALIDSINDIYRTRPISKVRPIKGLLQVVKLVVYIILSIVIIANLMGQSPLILLSGIGALAAVFSFVFKDSILGFIAGIQLTSNDMLRIGDWIEMPKYGADGDVIDITLNTVKVQNFDKTIVTIPAYSLISDSFKNWRGMAQFGGRRIKRPIYIDMNSIGFCSDEMIEKFKKIHYLNDYITEKEAELKKYNQDNNINTNLLINGRHMTNIGTFRAYVSNYLKNHPKLNKDMIQMVRQLPPTEHGLPIEIYCFSSDTKWENYEGIQADIFDHILSVVEEFGLRIFQEPTGYDLKQINSGVSKASIE